MQLNLPPNLQLCKLPVSAEVMLFLISEEMKNRRQILKLEQAGFDSRPDSLYKWYTELLDTSCEKASPADVQAWKEAALEMYILIRLKAAENTRR